ncbi:dicarboxylate transporter/tellurite-resistance protein TehA [Enterovirga sp. CN4-39]|uniref:dicarboxylate transporter/tellurite-resistance protein TehA n=1 Tax=Enterovirga sp. CN4-39 TaxID=3400910 RepID=UPI003C0BBC05
MPASYFGMVLGLAGLGNAWHAAVPAWQLPALTAEVIYLFAGLVWAGLIALYLVKALAAPQTLAAEAAHPVHCCFIGLAGVATMLIAGALVPHARPLAWALYAIGFFFTVGFAVWRTGGLWQGSRHPDTTTPVLYLPTVAGSFVAATVAARLGHPDIGQLAFGAGMFSWLAIESVLLHRLLTSPALAVELRPTLGIQLAPAPVGAVAYLAVGTGAPDVFAHAIIGYGLLQLLVLSRLALRLAEAGAVAGLWAFSFGLTALATAPAILVARGETGALAALAVLLFAVANLAVGGLSFMTLKLAANARRLLPSTPPAARTDLSARTTR